MPWSPSTGERPWQARLVGAAEELLDDEIADPWRPHLAHQLGLTPAEAGQVVALVDRLAVLPMVAGVLARGEPSPGTVLASASRATPETEALLVGSTDHLTGGQLVRRAVAARLAGRDESRSAPDTVQTTSVLHATESEAGLRLHGPCTGGQPYPIGWWPCSSSAASSLPRWRSTASPCSRQARPG